MFKWLSNLFFQKPKGIDNPFEFYPEAYEQDSNQSIVKDGRYDMTRFSEGEDRTIKQIIDQANRKYTKTYRAIGLANESYPVVYKPRYILFDVICIVFGDSDSPFDQLAVSFANIQKRCFV